MVTTGGGGGSGSYDYITNHVASMTLPTVVEN